MIPKREKEVLDKAWLLVQNFLNITDRLGHTLIESAAEELQLGIRERDLEFLAVLVARPVVGRLAMMMMRVSQVGLLGRRDELELVEVQLGLLDAVSEPVEERLGLDIIRRRRRGLITRFSSTGGCHRRGILFVEADVAFS